MNQLVGAFFKGHQKNGADGCVSRHHRPPPLRKQIWKRDDEEAKLHDLTEFEGGMDPKICLEWEQKIERIFDCKDLDNQRHFKNSTPKPIRHASLRYESLKEKWKITWF